MIDTNTCNAQISSGCPKTSPTAATGTAPDGLAIDRTTHTLYVSNGIDNSVSIIDTPSCNTTTTAGRDAHPLAIPLSGSPAGGALDSLTGTLLVPVFNLAGDIASAVSLIDTTRCSARHTAHCDQPLPAMTIGFAGGAVAADEMTNTIYASAHVPDPAGDQDGPAPECRGASFGADGVTGRSRGLRDSPPTDVAGREPRQV